MSWTEFDAMAAKRRMKDYLTPDDLNTNACLELAATVLRGAAADLAQAARRAAEFPSKGNLAHLKACRDWYGSEIFQALSGGVVDGPAAAREIIRNALRGRKLPTEVMEE
jgi:hypothetical protein